MARDPNTSTGRNLSWLFALLGGIAAALLIGAVLYWTIGVDIPPELVQLQTEREELEEAVDAPGPEQLDEPGEEIEGARYERAGIDEVDDEAIVVTGEGVISLRTRLEAREAELARVERQLVAAEVSDDRRAELRRQRDALAEEVNELRVDLARAVARQDEDLTAPGEDERVATAGEDEE